MGLQQRKPGKLERWIVVVVEIVDAHDLVAALEQPLRHMHADKAGATGDQSFHGLFLRLRSPLRRPQCSLTCRSELSAKRGQSLKPTQPVTNTFIDYPVWAKRESRVL
jgi:hypothetical protein